MLQERMPRKHWYLHASSRECLGNTGTCMFQVENAKETLVLACFKRECLGNTGTCMLQVENA